MRKSTFENKNGRIELDFELATLGAVNRVKYYKEANQTWLYMSWTFIWWKKKSHRAKLRLPE